MFLHQGNIREFRLTRKGIYLQKKSCMNINFEQLLFNSIESIIQMFLRLKISSVTKGLSVLSERNYLLQRQELI